MIVVRRPLARAGRAAHRARTAPSTAFQRRCRRADARPRRGRDRALPGAALGDGLRAATRGRATSSSRARRAPRWRSRASTSSCGARRRARARSRGAARRAALRAGRRPRATSAARAGASTGDLDAARRRRRATACCAAPTYPDALAPRVVGAALPRRRATSCSRPRPGYEFADWGGVDHVGGGSHGSLHRSDSLGALAVLRRRPAGRRPPAALVDRRRRADDPRATSAPASRADGSAGSVTLGGVPVRAALRAVAIAAFALALLGGLAAAALAQTAGSSTAASGPAAPATTTQTDPNAAVPVPRMDKRARGLPPDRLSRCRRSPSATRSYREGAREVPRVVPERLREGVRAAGRSACFSPGAKPKEIAQVYVDDATGPRDRGLDRVPGRVDDGPRLPRRVRAQGQRAVGLDPALAPVHRAVRRPAPARSGCSTSTCSCSRRSRSRVAFFNDAQHRRSRSRSPTRCCVYLLGAHAVDRAAPRPPAAGAAGSSSRSQWPRDRGRLPDRLPDRRSTSTSSNVIDVGYAGVIGADRIADGTRLYGTFPKDNEHGDTYGPVNYVAYVPFEQIWPWSGRLGRPARRARRGDRLRPALPAAAVPRRPARARAGPRASRSPTRGRRTRSRSTR